MVIQNQIHRIGIVQIGPYIVDKGTVGNAFNAAQEHFADCAEACPQDPVVQHYLSRCQQVRYLGDAAMDSGLPEAMRKKIAKDFIGNSVSRLMNLSIT